MATKTREEKESKALPAEGAKVNRRNNFEQFLDDNKNIISYIAAAIFGIVLLYAGYRYFIIRPQEERAQREVFMAQQYFEKDSLNLALNGDGTNMGFIDIADEYSSTSTGNLANFYAGVIFMQQENYDAAIEYLENFSTGSKMFRPTKFGLIGDAYSQLQDYERAARNYMRAVRADKNEFTAPKYLFKAGLVYEETGKLSDALDAFEKIKSDYPDSHEGQRIETYIARVEAAMFANRSR